MDNELLATFMRNAEYLAFFIRTILILQPRSITGSMLCSIEGQESCGIVVNDAGIMHDHKDNGLVNEVFNREVLDKLGLGNVAVGHVRYGTTGSTTRLNAQPLIINHIKGINGFGA